MVNSDTNKLTLGLVIVESKAQDRDYVPANDSELEKLKASGKAIELCCSIEPTCSSETSPGESIAIPRLMFCTILTPKPAFLE